MVGCDYCRGCSWRNRGNVWIVAFFICEIATGAVVVIVDVAFWFAVVTAELAVLLAVTTVEMAVFETVEIVESTWANASNANMPSDDNMINENNPASI
ncbi:hypothetical protein DYY66_1868 [Candidatus Nitrosotalea sp. FS]|nr:hypothetical protein [Candidatus Nitrosotalea sp. FS]